MEIIRGSGSMEMALKQLRAEYGLDQAQTRALINTVEDQITSLSNMRAINHGQVASVIGRLSQLTIDSPVRRVSVSTIDLPRGQAKVNATTTSVTQALAYADALRDSGLFTEVVISSISGRVGAGGAGAPVMTFVLAAPYTELTR